jgi:asparagine synthase (glutamine-hydrolysing)
MCGITGIVNFDFENNVDNHVLKKMMNTLVHRGPDDEGMFIKNNVGLGFRRLSIIDLETGHQPLSNENETVWIIFNGELYNFKELRTELAHKGHKFSTESDTEVVIHLYEEYGFDCLSYLRGMFSFSIWDDNKKLLFCARDRFGKKPFYYYISNSSFIWASEIKAILKHDEVDKEINILALDQYFAFGYIDGSYSIYESIQKLPAAHYMVVHPFTKEKIIIRKYWDINFNPDNSITEQKFIELFYSTFSDAVKLRLISDVPLGAFLSGGIDSSSVVSMMSKHQSKVKTFSIGFEEDSFNELPYAREIVNKYDTEHHEMIIKPDCINILPSLVRAFDEPFADSSAIPTYYVTKFASEHVTVALSGDGGDELFVGYNNYPQFLSIARKNFLPTQLKFGLNFLINYLPDNIRGKKLINYLRVKRNHEYAFASIWQNYERVKLLNNSIIDSNLIKAEQFKENILSDIQSKISVLSSLQYLDILTYLANDILVKVDRTSMHHSLEVRSPFLDHKLAELAFRIPDSIKFKRNIQKYIIKAAMQDLLSERILNHPKQGFSVPLKKWFQEDLHQYLAERLNSGPNMKHFFNINYVFQILDYHKRGFRDYGSKLWAILFFLEWYEYQKSI